MDKLILKIREVFEENEVNFCEIQRMLEEYKSEPNDWRQYAHFDEHKYTRNLVDAGNGKYNLMILCWGPGMGSSIHDHSAAQCFVKVLGGQLLETRFAWPWQQKEKEEEEEEGQNGGNGEGHEDGGGGPMRTTGTELFKTNGVSYISDKIGLHRMENPSHADPTVTLHLYIPPYSQCYSFDQRTGRKQQCSVTFHSRYGQKMDYGSGEGKVAAKQQKKAKGATRDKLAEKNRGRDAEDDRLKDI